MRAMNRFLLVTAMLALPILPSCSKAGQGKGAAGGGSAFVPFESVDGIVPGTTKYSEVERRFGRPDEVEVTERKVVAGMHLGGNSIAKYTTRGMCFIFVEPVDTDPVVDGIYVEAPYAGRTANGLFIGQPEADARAVIERDWFITNDLGASVLIAKARGGDSDLQVWFQDGRVSRMKIFRP
jgi:hypothetical protein